MNRDYLMQESFDYMGKCDHQPQTKFDSEMGFFTIQLFVAKNVSGDIPLLKKLDLKECTVILCSFINSFVSIDKRIQKPFLNKTSLHKII